jgi:CRISPR-associated protein Csd1
MQKLYDTYNHCAAWVGEYDLKRGKRPLAPLCHIAINAHVEVTLDEDGNIQGARPITNQNDMTTIIPATEDSASKTSGIAPHPLIDKLQYVAGDFIECGGTLPKTYQGEGKKKKDPKQIHEAYCNELREWCNNAQFSHPKARAVLKYIEKGTLVKDLARYGILYLGDDGKFLRKKAVKRNKDTQDIFAVPKINDQEDAVVRWSVEIDDGTEMKTWHDETLWQSWQNYYLSKRKGESRSFCYITGKEAILTNKHPKYIRKPGDSPKLISSNDTERINYYGRLGEAADAACLVGLETSQKAHNALVWLIDRQGTVFEEKDGKPGLTILAWETSSTKEIPQPTQDSIEIGVDIDAPEEDEAEKPLAGQEFATRLEKKMLGYKADLKDSEGIYIIALDALSQGRMAVTYYQEFEPEVYLENIEKWHRECVWEHYYLRKYYRKPFAPALLDIAEVIHGQKAGSKIKHHTVSRLLPCVVEGRSLPRDIVDVAVRQASKRMGLHDPDDKKFRGDDEYTWRKTLTIACALVKKYMIENNKIPKEKENDVMTLDPTNPNRDYLYGRLLAIADHLESKALRDEEGKQKRPTNAARMMQQFSQRPYRTWKQIHDALPPYFWRLSAGTAAWYKDQVAEVCGKFVPEEYKSDDPLTGEYLLGYYCQWEELRKFGKSVDASDDEVETDEDIIEDDDNDDADSEESDE